MAIFRKIAYRILRFVIVIPLAFLTIVFIPMQIIQAGVKVPDEYFETAKYVVLFMCLGVMVLGVILIRRVLSWKKDRKKSRIERLRDQGQKQALVVKLLDRAKACPVCGARLAVCEKGDDNAFIRLTTIYSDVQAEYCCTACDQRFDIKQPLADFADMQRVLPQQQGTRYRVTGNRKRGLIGGAALLAVFAAFCICITIRGVYLLIQSANIMYAGPLLGFGFGAFAFSSMAFRYFSAWHDSIAFLYELVDDGLIIHERIGTRFYAWEDFRIVAYVPGSRGHGEAYAFDLKQRVLLINDNYERYSQLVGTIIAHVGETARIDPEVPQLSAPKL